MKSIYSLMSSSHVQAISALFGTALIVIFIDMLIERFLPDYHGPIPVLIAVFAGCYLATGIIVYLKRRFQKDKVGESSSIDSTTISRSFVVGLLGLHAFVIAAIIFA